VVFFFHSPLTIHYSPRLLPPDRSVSKKIKYERLHNAVGTDPRGAAVQMIRKTFSSLANPAGSVAGRSREGSTAAKNRRIS